MEGERKTRVDTCGTILAKRIEIPWPREPWRKVRKGTCVTLGAFALVVGLYVLTAPPIIKEIWKFQIRHSQRVRWPEFYGPFMVGLENDSPAIHGPFRWYFNTVWGCGIGFFSDPGPAGQD